MAKPDKHTINAEEYRRYLKGKMSPAERHIFERALLNDPFAAEALEGMESVTPQEVGEDLKSLKIQLYGRSKRKTAPVIWRIAAGLLLLGIFSFVIYYFIETHSPVQVAQEKSATPTAVDTLPSHTESSPPTEPAPNIAYKSSEEDASQTKRSTPAESPKIQDVEIQTPEADDEVILDLAYNAPEEQPESRAEDRAEKIIENPVAIEPAATPAEAKKEAEKIRADSPPKNARQKSVAGAVATVSAARVVKGQVISAEDDSPLPGVNVIIKGTSTGTVTNIDGYFEVPVNEGDSPTLIFNSVGFVTEEVILAKNTVIDVVLEPDVTSLSEIVVMGYSSQERESPTYSFTPPKPSIGQQKYNKYVEQNLRYPDSAKSTGVKGSVRVQFTVQSNGTITNLEIIRSLGDDFDAEAIRIIRDGPAWEPAVENGTKVARVVKISIRFKPTE